MTYVELQYMLFSNLGRWRALRGTNDHHHRVMCAPCSGECGWRFLWNNIPAPAADDIPVHPAPAAAGAVRAPRLWLQAAQLSPGHCRGLIQQRPNKLCHCELRFRPTILEVIKCACHHHLKHQVERTPPETRSTCLLARSRLSCRHGVPAAYLVLRGSGCNAGGRGSKQSQLRSPAHAAGTEARGRVRPQPVKEQPEKAHLTQLAQHGSRSTAREAWLASQGAEEMPSKTAATADPGQQCCLRGVCGS